MSLLISKYPLRDINVISWVVFCIVTYFYGINHFFVIGLCLGVCFVCNRVIQAKRPVEYDAKYQPSTDILPNSYGLPSVESFMSVAIFSHAVHISKQWNYAPLAILLIILIGFSRIYSRSRFLHQIVLSWVFSIPTLVVSILVCDHLALHRLSEFDIAGIVIVSCVLFACLLGLAIESNESILAYVPKEEFLRVLVNIVDGNDSKQSNDSPRVFSSPRSRTIKLNQERTPGDLPDKRDSFYYLQKSLQRRTR